MFSNLRFLAEWIGINKLSRAYKQNRPLSPSLKKTTRQLSAYGSMK